MSTPVLSVRELVTSFPVGAERVPVVDGISLDVHPGEVLALVGESGCGKSVTAFSALRLIPRPGRIDAGQITLAGRDVLALSVSEMRRVRGGDAAMIFQEPMTSLNPVQTVGRQVVEAIRLHERIGFDAAREQTVALFDRVKIPDAAHRFDAYPHQLSGGLKQRVMIAMALAMRPKLLIADEPTTALDVTIQAQILTLMRELQHEKDTGILLITHDLGVVNELADRIAVMYAGRIVEEGTRTDILSRATHPYTRGLLRSVPSLGRRGEKLEEIAGVVPQPQDWPAGCRFSTRCGRVLDRCRAEVPGDTAVSSTHTARCFNRVQASGGGAA